MTFHSVHLKTVLDPLKRELRFRLSLPAFLSRVGGYGTVIVFLLHVGRKRQGDHLLFPDMVRFTLSVGKCRTSPERLRELQDNKRRVERKV